VSAIRIWWPWPRARRIVTSIVVRFHPTNLTAEQYDHVVRREKATGKYPPDGREYHVCFGSGGDLRVSEIWDSLEQLQAYSEVLMPILADAGIQFSAEPEVFEVYNIVKR
jgi:hypothetical protein